jgi:hypothetical protein
VKKKTVPKSVPRPDVKERLLFDKEPMCEICGKEKADSFSNYGQQSGIPDWRFVGNCQNNAMAYHVEFEGFFESPAEMDNWVDHLTGKGWIGLDFLDMMLRLLKATGSYGKE